MSLENVNSYPAIVLSSRQMCDFELLVNGGFAPLDGFLNEDDYISVVKNMRLANGKLWPMPIVLPVSDENVDKYRNEKIVVLKDLENYPLAFLHLESVFKPNLEEECLHVYGTTDTNHPYVDIVLSNPNIHYLGGRLEKINMPRHYDFTDLRKTPEETKQYFKENGWDKVVAFQTRNPMHRSHIELTLNSLKSVGENTKLMIHPVVGVTQDCDINYHTKLDVIEKY